jgi:NTP pyrophosphatase (non-canonical NTP hydrolase)
MDLAELTQTALRLNELYEQLETRQYGRAWTVQELTLGFMGDVGDLAKLVQAHTGVRDIDNVKARLGHELSDCLWSILVLADKCGIDLEAEYASNLQGLIGHVAGQLAGPEA